MDDDIEFNEAAFTHGLTKEKILWTVKHPMYEGPLENEDNKYIVLGFDTAGNRAILLAWNCVGVFTK
jgi:hypothetical protein